MAGVVPTKERKEEEKWWFCYPHIDLRAPTSRQPSPLVKQPSGHAQSSSIIRPRSHFIPLVCPLGRVTSIFLFVFGTFSLPFLGLLLPREERHTSAEHGNFAYPPRNLHTFTCFSKSSLSTIPLFVSRSTLDKDANQFSQLIYQL